MTTELYDLPITEWSVQGWDSIMATAMEILDAVIPTRIKITLGESVSAYHALYQKAADSKWYKAQADGTKQPCQGLAVESGSAEGLIRLVRMGKVTNASWAWGTIGGPIYLDPSTAGALTQTKPALNIQIIGYALSATSMIVLIAPNLPNYKTVIFCIPGPQTVGSNKAPSIIMPYSATIKKAYAYARTAPTGAALIFDINKDGTSIWNVTQANRVQIAAGANTGTQTSFDTTALAENNRLDVDVDQVGSTVAGSDVTVELKLEV